MWLGKLRSTISSTNGGGHFFQVMIICNSKHSKLLLLKHLCMNLFFFKLLNFLNLDMFGFVRWEWTTRAYFQMLNIWEYSILELRVAYNEILTGWVLGLIVSDERHQFFPPQSSLCFQNIRKINLRQSVLTQYQHIS